LAAAIESYLAIVRRAYEGSLKLPAFQRDWKWKPSQVTLLLDSLRQGFPIGSFLFIQANPVIDLSPREFRGSDKEASKAKTEELVLDGQQRITAGLELFYGKGLNHYFLDVRRISELAKEAKVDLDDRNAIRKFLSDLDADDGYCKRAKPTADPKSKLIRNKLLWTGLLLDDDELERAISEYAKAYPDEEKEIRYLVGRNFRPHPDSNIPVTTISGSTSIEAISRIFSTLNSTGKMLTPFELVVSVLFSNHVSLNEEVEQYRDLCPFYSRIDVTGDILLQTVALFDGKETKKASLPRTITRENYQKHSADCVENLNDCAKFISDRLGLGLNSSRELLVYPVIFTPFAYVWNYLKGEKLNHTAQSAAEQKLVRWFVGAVLSRRYQQSTHDKQARDKAEIVRWLQDDTALPDWMSETYIVNIRNSDPDGAIGKLFRALVNSRDLRDPLSGMPVGVGADKKPTAKHHVFPTRWVHNLKEWDKANDNANLALNIMYVEESTNSSWLNLDPRDQVNQSIKILGSEYASRDLYRQHGITDAAYNILLKPVKSRHDFFDFITERESFYAAQLEQYGFRRPQGRVDEADIEDDDEP
jgi:hypothetical protein